MVFRVHRTFILTALLLCLFGCGRIKRSLYAPDDRDQFVREACGDDATLRDEIFSLLKAFGTGRYTLEQLADFEDAVTRSEKFTSPSPEIPERIGPYKILETLGEGGMGIVFVAEQTEPVRRKVALKVIKLGMDTKEVVARFEAERQALAMMSHAGVARVHDAGITDDGRPYFVMEHVPGVPVTDYCDRECLGTSERLELFIKVCEAVQHAHQNGIIHRDLKPPNVLV